MSEFIKVIDAAKRLGVTRDTMYKICNSEGFPAFKLPTTKSNIWRIESAGFEQWIKNKGRLN